MENFDFGERPATVPDILKQIVFDDNMFRKLNAVDVVVNALEPDIAAAIEAKKFQKWLHHSFIDRKGFMRRLSLFSKMNENVETALELYGQDYITHPEFQYDDQYFRELIQLNKELNKFVGELLREYAKSDIKL